MARERSVLDDSDTAENGGMAADFDGKDGLLHRRGYLKLAGTAATAVAATAAASGAEDHDVIRIGQGERRVINVGSGETFANKLIDCTASGARVTIIAKGTNWTIRNVGIDGYLDVGEPDAVFGVADTGSNTSTIENVYLGDGAANAGQSTAETAIWVDPKHSGHLDINRVNVRGFSDNAIYASGPGGRGDGTVHIDRCFAANCRTAHYRIGSAGSKVTNSSVLLTNEGYDGRAVWVRKTGPCEVENCQLETNGRHYAIQAGAHDGGTSVTVSNTDYDTGFHGGYSERHGGRIRFADGVGNDPGAFVPEGVPKSAEAAATGSVDGSSSEDETRSEALDHTLLIDGAGTGGTTHYEFTASGAVEKATVGGASIDDEDAVDEGKVAGVVGGWRDAYRFGGDLESLSADGGATISLDGEPIDPAEYGETPATVVTIVGQGTRASYELTVDGTIEIGDDSTEATVSEGTAEGTIERGVARFEIDGELTDVTLVDGRAHVYVDDERIDPGTFGDGASLPHALVVDGSEASGPSTYSFTVDGRVAKAEYRSANVNADDVIEDGTVRGGVEGWRDAYWFSGDVVDFTLLGDATVDVELNVRDR